MAGLPLYLSLALILTLATARAHAQSLPLETSNPVFNASLDRIAKRSALWREALDAIRAAGRRAVIVTPDQVTVADEESEPALLAEVAPVLRHGQQVDVVVIVVNLALLEEQHRELRLLPIEFEHDLDRILIHEVYGHAIPYLLAGTVTGRCPDPQPGERVVDACAIRRENAVRAELGLGRRVDYGLAGLSVARRSRH